MVKFWFTDNPDLYKFNNKNKLEIILFKFGLIFSSTSLGIQEIDMYDHEKDEVVKGRGLRRISHFYKLKKSFPWVFEDSVLKTNIPIALL